jgi:hypothetical protein
MGIAHGFLSHEDGGDNEKFLWEDHFKLKRLSVSYRMWDLASKFGKPEKGMKKAVKIKSEADGKREVWYRDISGMFPIRIHVGYDSDFTWIEKVAQDTA